MVSNPVFLIKIKAVLKSKSTAISDRGAFISAMYYNPNHRAFKINFDLLQYKELFSLKLNARNLLR